MKRLISLLFFTIIIFSPTIAATSATSEKINNSESSLPRPQGTKLCNELYKDLKKNGFSPRTQNLTSSGTNDFPYNITISNKAYENSAFADNLIFEFTTEQAYDNLELIHNLAGFLKKNKFAFNTTILISYGENSFQSPKFNVYGTEAFIKTLNTDVNNIVINLNLGTDSNGFETGAMGKSVPAWLIKYTYSTLKNSGIQKELPHFYVSQLSKVHDRMDSILANYLMNDIPAITIFLNSDNETIQSFFENFTNNFVDNCQYEWDSHTIMFSIFGKTVWLNERTIVIILICIIFTSLAFLFLLSLINTSIKSQAWNELKKIWYAIPAFFIVIVGINYLVRLFFVVLGKNGAMFSPYTIIYAQISFATPFIIALCFFEMKFHNKYGARAIDFMTLLVAFINQFLFSLIDISLFPLFMAICIITILSIILKKNRYHIILLFVMFLPLFPYIYKLLHTSQTGMLAFSIIQNPLMPVFEAFFTLPFYLMGYRILKASRINKFLSAGIIYSTLLVFMFILSITIFQTKTDVRQNRLTTTYVNDNLIKINHSDKTFFGETIRTLNIDLGEEAEYCCVEVSGWGNQAVLYSENGYEIEDASTTFFRIPKNPPKKLSFSYGTVKDISTISVTAFYKTDEQNILKERNFTLTIKDSL
ncbi:MAG: hypothetical protein K6A43_09900 [Treponema sp.]|nr:hypothetical protein [Treponema sp.]